MKVFAPTKPKQKYIIPKERPSSFLLNEGEKNEFLYELNNAELLNSNYEPNKMKNHLEDNDYYLGNENNSSEEYECCNSILKTLKFMSRSLSNCSIDTKTSDNNY